MTEKKILSNVFKEYLKKNKEIGCLFFKIQKEIQKEKGLFKEAVEKGSFNEILVKIEENSSDLIKDNDLKDYKNKRLVHIIAAKFHNYIQSDFGVEQKKANNLINMLEQMEHLEHSEVLQYVTSTNQFLLLRKYLLKKYAWYGQSYILDRNDLCSILNNIDNIVFSSCLWIWEGVIKKRRKGPPYSKRVLMCEDKLDAKELTWHKDELNIRIRAELKRYELAWTEQIDIIVEFYNDFLIDEIYTDEIIWKIYYSNEQIRKQYRDYKFQNIKEEVLEAIKEWGCIDTVTPIEATNKNFIEYNYEVNLYFQYAKKLVEYADIPFVNKDMQLYYQKSSVDRENVEFWIENIFINDRAKSISGKIFTSIIKEILYLKWANEKKKKREWFNVIQNKTIDEVYDLQDEHGMIKQSVWGIDGKAEKIVAYYVKQSFTPEFQIKRDTDPDLYNLITKGKCKDRKFSSLINKSMYFQEGVSYFEQYMIELNTGIMTAWRLYDSTYEMLPLLGNKKDDLLVKLVTDLVKSISSIHNLEERTRISGIVSEILKSMYENYNVRLYEEIKLLNESVRQYAERFNRWYDDMFCILYLLVEEQGMEYVSELKDMPEEAFSKLQRQSFQLVNKKKNNVMVNPVLYYRYEDLYHADAKSQKYYWFNLIWNHVSKGQAWVENLL